MTVEQQDEHCKIWNRGVQKDCLLLDSSIGKCPWTLNGGYRIGFWQALRQGCHLGPPGLTKSALRVANLGARVANFPSRFGKPSRPVLNTERAFTAVFRLSLSDFGRNLVILASAWATEPSARPIVRGERTGYAVTPHPTRRHDDEWQSLVDRISTRTEVSGPNGRPLGTLDAISPPRRTRKNFSSIGLQENDGSGSFTPVP